MCRSRYVYWVAGLLVGVSLLLAGGYYGARSLMAVETESPHDFQKTVDLINVVGHHVPDNHALSAVRRQRGPRRLEVLSR
jgi:hypothetical protein